MTGSGPLERLRQNVTGVFAILMADAGAGETDPLEELKRRYAKGELSEAEFERKTQRLLEVDELARTADTDRTAGSRAQSARDENTAESDLDQGSSEPDEREVA